MDGAAPAGDPPRFIVDAMLGRLARWLRILGFDTVFDTRADDVAIATRAVRERRTVLTRDHGLLARRLVARGLFIASEDVSEQLRQVIRDLALTVDEALVHTRCVHCNGALVPAARDEVAGRVPPFVLRHHDDFRRCPDCSRIYWGGTHQDHVEERLRAWFPGAFKKSGHSLDEPPGDL